MLHSGLQAALQEGPRGAGVVAVVLEGLSHGLGHDGEGRKVHDRIDAVLAQHLEHRLPVAHLAYDEGRIEHGLAEASRQVIQHDHALSAPAKLEHHVAADVAGAAGHEDAGLFHAQCGCVPIGPAMINKSETPFAGLSPQRVLDAASSVGLDPDGRLFALNSYENRVYQLGTSEGMRVLKFYRPARWSDAQILEEHRFTAELAAAELPVAAPLAVQDR